MPRKMLCRGPAESRLQPRLAAPRRLGPDVVFGKIPFDRAALAGGKVNEVRGGGRVVAGHGVLPIGLAPADGIEEVAEVREGRLGAFIPEMLDFLPGTFGRLDLGGDHLGVLIISVFERLRPGVHDPAVVLDRIFGMEGETLAAGGQAAFGAQDLELAFDIHLVVE